MKIISTIIFIFLLSFSATVSQAQLLDKIKDKAEKAAENILTGDDAREQQEPEKTRGETRPGRAAVSAADDFVPAATVLFEDDFSGDRPGNMPHTWKSSGSGQIVTFPGESGKWLLLNEFTTYKLDTLLAMPGNFTLEFDVVTRSDQAKDLESLSFGFALDNSVRSYISDAYNDNALTSTTVHYWNEEVINSSSRTGIYNTLDADLAGYANATMHVAVSVRGEQMKVYLDNKKMLDTKMFRPGDKKYFYVSTSTTLDNGAQIGIGNFRLAE